jgi:hypothetical protein
VITMPIRIRTAFLASVAVTVALVVDAPAAGASPFPVSTFPAAEVAVPVPAGGDGVASPCARPSGAEGQGSTGEVHNQVCQAGGLSFVGPAIGQIATVIGPTIIGPANIGASISSAGDVAIG